MTEEEQKVFDFIINEGNYEEIYGEEIYMRLYSF